MQQNLTGGTGSGSTFTASVNPANNQLVGYSYDAAGNTTYDGFHTYTYDAEGHITAVDGGQTAQYVYNAQNQRVRDTVGSTATEYVFNAAGQRVSEWNGTILAQIKGKYYWGAMPVAYYAGGAAHFEHQDWLGTERMRTSYNGGVEGSYISLPFGDGQVTSGSDTDANHYAQLDHDTESDTDHAQFRQYSNAQGRWLSPDPYSGSYDASNPQSMNRYVYALNNPLAAVDSSGLDTISPYQQWCVSLDGDHICAIQEVNTGSGGGGDGFFWVTELEPVWVPGYEVPYGDYVPGYWTYQQVSYPFYIPVVTVQNGGVGGGGGGAAANTTGCKTGLGIGITAGADAGAGVGVIGVGANGSVGAALFAGNGVNAGVFASGGAGANFFSHAVSAVKSIISSNFVGAGTGIGVGVFITNASQASQLNGPSATWNVDLGWVANGAGQITQGQMLQEIPSTPSVSHLAKDMLSYITTSLIISLRKEQVNQDANVKIS